MNKKRIVFFTPTFERTGSELALFNLIINVNKDFDITVVSKNAGELSFNMPPDIKFISSEISFTNKISKNSLFGRKLKKGLSALRPQNSFLKKIYRLYPADFWYINTITLPEVLEFAHKNKIASILHIHELEQMYNCLSGEQLNNIISYPQLIIACSQTCSNVVKMCGRENKVEVCHPAIDYKNIAVSFSKTNEIRLRHGIKDNTFLWLMSGTMDTNKNPSVFVDIASDILKSNLDVSFMWLKGRNDSNGYIEYCKKKSVTLGIANKIIWIPKLIDEYYDYFNACDGFVLTSVKESFSMVAAEALYLGKPVVSYDCGGINEILSEQTGIIVPGYNTEVLIEAMMMIMNKKFIYDSSKAKATALKFEASLQAEKWKKLLNNNF
jgi:glycosyltransferase involved in cell wall biosynthesis